MHRRSGLVIQALLTDACCPVGTHALPAVAVPWLHAGEPDRVADGADVGLSRVRLSGRAVESVLKENLNHG
jgi:hypothetical protein